MPNSNFIAAIVTDCEELDELVILTLNRLVLPAYETYKLPTLGIAFEIYTVVLEGAEFGSVPVS